MRVSQLSVEVKVELFGKRKFLVSHLDVLVLTLFNDGTSVHGLNDSVNRVFEVLDHNRLAHFDGHLNSLNHLAV